MSVGSTLLSFEAVAWLSASAVPRTAARVNRVQLARQNSHDPYASLKDRLTRLGFLGAWSFVMGNLLPVTGYCLPDQTRGVLAQGPSGKRQKNAAYGDDRRTIASGAARTFQIRLAAAEISRKELQDKRPYFVF